MSDLLITKSPAAWHRDLWREASPSGNGQVGILVYGHVAEETVVLNHSALWHHSRKGEVPALPGALERTRQMIDEGDFWNANWIITNALKEKGFEAALGAPFPVCALHFRMHDSGDFHHYRRILHMESGEVQVRWQEGEDTFLRQGFVSRADDVVVFRIHSSRPLDVTVGLALHETGEPDTEQKREELGDSLRVEAQPPFIEYAGTNDDGTDFGAVARVIGPQAQAEESGIRLRGEGDILVLVKLFVESADREESFRQAEEALLALSTEYDVLLARHQALHEPLYRSAELEIEEEPCGEAEITNEHLLEEAYDEGAPNALLNRLWKFGRYLLICGTRPGALPFPMYGIFHGRYSMAWPHNMANENLQMIYWHVLGGGLKELFEPVMDYFLEQMPQFRDNARKLFGLPGIYMPAGTTPGNAVPNQIVPVIMNWIGCAGWIAEHFYSYYQYSGDEQLLKEKILPFMKEAADFYEAYLVKGEDGWYKIYPSVSPENTPKSLMPGEEWEHMSHPCPSAINATMDIAIIKELLTNLCEAAELTGQYQEKVAAWQEIIQHLPAYEATEEGDVREWQWPGLTQRYNHRHLSHIYPMFPGREIVKGVAPKELVDTFEKAVDKRLLGAQTGWSLAHMACINARFERPEKALECLDILCRACLTKSFLTLHNDWRNMGLTLYRDHGAFAPIQLDASMGIVGAMQEMLLFAQPACVKLLPALPKRWKKGHARLRYMQGEVEISWNQETGALAVQFRPERGADIQVLLPDVWAEGLKLSDGTPFVNGDTLRLDHPVSLGR